MSTATVPFNPFQPPAVAPEIVKPSLDDLEIPQGEYRIHNDRILISGDIEFPQICVRTGDTKTLIQQEATVYVTAPTGIVVAMFFGFLQLIGMLSIFLLTATIAMSFDDHAFEAIVTIFPLIFVLMGFPAARLAQLLKEPARICYCESATWRESRNRRNRIIYSIALGGLTIAFGYVWMKFEFPILLPYLLLLILAGVFPPKWIGVNRLNARLLRLNGIPADFLRDNPFPDIGQKVTESTEPSETPPPVRWEPHIASAL